MNELIQAALWAAGLFTLVTGLLYVLAVIDPQTRAPDPAPTGARSTGRPVRTG